jgi:hypothetical protein
MKTTCNALRLQFDESGKPELVLSVIANKVKLMAVVASLKEIVAKGKQLSVEIKQNRQRRSLDSNGYLWVLCQKIAEKIQKHTKEDVYKEAIRKVGQFDYLAVAEDAAEQFIKVWNSRGLGWYAEEMDSKISGCKKIMAYYGSSCYDSRQMAVLIDYIIDECKTLDIETLPPEQIAAMNREWGKE